MSRIYLSYGREQRLLLPPDLREWLPEGHLALFISDVVDELSRKIEQATYEDVAFRVLECNQHPDHDSIANFRQLHLAELAWLFVQVLQMCERAGLVKLGHVAVDGSKLRANASQHKAMSYDRMRKRSN